MENQRKCFRREREGSVESWDCWEGWGMKAICPLEYSCWLTFLALKATWLYHVKVIAIMNPFPPIVPPPPFARLTWGSLCVPMVMEFLATSMCWIIAPRGSTRTLWVASYRNPLEALRSRRFHLKFQRREEEGTRASDFPVDVNERCSEWARNFNPLCTMTKPVSTVQGKFTIIIILTLF